jgi:hypothetical protein
MVTVAAAAAAAAAVGSLEQRLSQLREAYDFVTHTNGVPPYKVGDAWGREGEGAQLPAKLSCWWQCR